MTEEAGPEYQRIMSLIRSRIIDGTYPVASPIPSTAKLVTETGKTAPVVRRAVDQLKAEGILRGQPGKAVFVEAVPADADRRRADTEALGDTLAAVQSEVRKLARDTAEYDDLRARVGRIEAILITMHSRLGFPNPFGGERDTKKTTSARGRASG